MKMIRGLPRWAAKNWLWLLVLGGFATLLVHQGSFRIQLNRMYENGLQVHKEWDVIEQGLTLHHRKHGAFPETLAQLKDSSPPILDPFAPESGTPYRYATWTNEGDWWLLVSLGPDETAQYPPDLIVPSDDPRLPTWAYDPTNGTYSPGDIIRYGGVAQ